MNSDSMYPHASLEIKTVSLSRGETITVYLNPNEPFQDAPADVQSVELRVRHDGTLELFAATDAVRIREWSDGWESLRQASEATQQDVAVGQ